MLLKTYSIWICFNLDENCLNQLHMVDTPLLGNHVWDGDTDLMNVVLVGLNEQLTKETLDGTESNLHYLLGTLFSNKLEAAEKIQLLDKRFQMRDDIEIRKELDEMCNLSYIILEEGMEKGLEKGREEGIKEGIKESKRNMVREMLLDHQEYALIRRYAGVTDEEIKQVEEELLVRK